MRRVLIIAILVLIPVSAIAEYSIPSDRTMTWAGTTGLDPVGGIPNYSNVTCNGLDPTGVTDNAALINTCIQDALTNEAVYLPAGTYLISGANINMKSYTVLRGAGANYPWLPSASSGSTVLSLNGRHIMFDGGTKASNWTPGTSQGISISAGYSSGSTSITVADASAISVGNVISIFQNNDPAIIDVRTTTWLGEDDGTSQRVLQQYSTVTGKNGNVLTIDPPISYVTPSGTSYSPAIRKQIFNLELAGLEDIKINRQSTSDNWLIYMRFSRNCWIKNVETYNAGNISSGSPHFWGVFNYQNEIRDSYFHHGESYDSGRSYGIELYNWNSSMKIENNILIDLRHAIAFEGGGSNNAILYNYTDDNGESVQGQGTVRDTNFLGEDAMANHGAHPHMNLWEGNSHTSWWSDYTQGSSSHHTLFRNHIRCKNTNIALSGTPWLWTCIEIHTKNYYDNLVGNVIGLPTFTTGTIVDNNSPGTWPAMYRFGHPGAGENYNDTQSYASTIKHGNYDYVGDAVAHWDGGSDHAIANSLYYATKPAWFGNVIWPPVNSAGPTVADLPAKLRYEGKSYPYGAGVASTGLQTKGKLKAVGYFRVKGI